MDSADRPEFERLLAMLCVRADKPCPPSRIDAWWTSLRGMGIVTFTRVVQQLLERQDSDKLATVSDVWRVSRALRAPAQSMAQVEADRASEPVFDSWTRAANDHLLRYIRRRIALHDRARYGGITQQGYYPQPTAAMQQRVALLVYAKNAWALHMRECPEDRTPAFMERLWTELMQAAEEQIDRLMAGLATELERAS